MSVSGGTQPADVGHSAPKPQARVLSSLATLATACPPRGLTWRAPALASAAYLAAAALSYVDPRLAIACCILVFAEAARRDSDLSLFLLIFALPFDRIFYIGESDQLIVLAAQLALQVVALAYHRRADPFALLQRHYWAHTIRYTAWPLLAAYVLLAVAYGNPGTDWGFHLKTLAFGSATLLLIMIYDGRMGEPTIKSVILAITIGSLVQIAIDAAFLGGARAMLVPPETLPFDPVINGRLMGLTISSNDLAEFLLCGFCFVSASLVLGLGGRRAWRLLLAAVIYWGVAFTLSKAAMVAAAAILLGALLSFLLLRRWSFALRTATVFALCIVAGFAAVAEPVVMPRITAFIESVLTARDMPAPPARPDVSAEQIMQYRLRVGIASEQTSDVDRRNREWTGAITCELACTGHRDELWAAGLDVVRKNWLTGIGFGGWRFEMHQRLGFGYTSPHNATLHLWGMFGLLGLALNLGLYGLVVRRAYGLRSMVTQGSRDVVWAVASTAFIVAVMVHEVFETSMILSLSRFGLFSWLILAVQSSAICNAQRSNEPAIDFRQRAA